MTFTSHRRSYVDRRLDYIQISLDTACGAAGYWLPTSNGWRSAPAARAGLCAGAVIMGGCDRRLHFQRHPPPALFAGYPVEAVPHAQRENYRSRRDIYADLRRSRPRDRARAGRAARAGRGTAARQAPERELRLCAAHAHTRSARAVGRVK